MQNYLFSVFGQRVNNAKVVQIGIRRYIHSAKRECYHGDVLSVSIANNFRQIVSASRDKTVKAWNTIGECMQTLTSHSDWVSADRFSLFDKINLVISASWDKTAKESLLFLHCSHERPR